MDKRILNTIGGAVLAGCLIAYATITFQFYLLLGIIPAALIGCTQGRYYTYALGTTVAFLSIGSLEVMYTVQNVPTFVITIIGICVLLITRIVHKMYEK